MSACCSSSRTRTSPSTSPTTPISSRPAASSSPAPRPRSARTRRSGGLISGIRSEHRARDTPHPDPPPQGGRGFASELGPTPSPSTGEGWGGGGARSVRSGRSSMSTFFHQVLSGLATGGIYASIALALVMIHQATHLVNFAQGEMAMFSTYLAWAMIDAGMPYWGSFPLTIVLSLIGGIVIERVIIRPMENAPVLASVIVFIGLLVIFNSVAGWIFTYTIKSFPSPFPAEPLWGNSYISTHDLGAIGITLVVLVLLFAFFRYTPLGLAMRAAAENKVSSRLVGIRVGWMLALGWGLAAAIGAVAR